MAKNKKVKRRPGYLELTQEILRKEEIFQANGKEYSRTHIANVVNRHRVNLSILRAVKKAQNILDKNYGYSVSESITKAKLPPKNWKEPTKIAKKVISKIKQRV